jgi:pSer/pThr/pTyr-binding forkhead associated (FHA) protein
MAKLVLSSGGSIVHQCFLDRERVIVGRAPHNHVVIDDPAVSDEHAAIITVGNDHILEHSSKFADTLVNGSPVIRHILQHGDTMQFGAFYLRYLNPRASADSDLDRTMLISGLQARVHHGAQPESGPAAKAVHVQSAHATDIRFPRGKVKVIAGSRTSGTIRLDRVVATFGKPGKELAVVARRPRGYFIAHVEGRRSARVNGQSIGKDARLLRHGDIIEVAEEKLEFLLD